MCDASSHPRSAARQQDNAEPDVTAVTRVAGHSVVLLLRAYQLALSPLLPPACRFEPSCSHYASEAVATHGVVHGGWLALRRVLRCHPWSDPGFDPVPTPPPVT
jgi:uncharacterized protein